MTQPGAPVTQGELMRLLVQQVPALARRSVPVPSKRLGTVASFDGYGTAQVTLDGDASPVAIQVAVPGGVFAGQRVVVDFYPPHGALVTGVLGPSTGEQVWAAAWSVASSVTVSDSPTTWTLETSDVGGGGWDAAAGSLVCSVPGWWEVTMAGNFESSTAGTQRAMGLSLNAAPVFLSMSEQFSSPSGDTTGYGLSMGTGSGFEFAAGDVVTAAARQDSGGVLDATLRVHLRWFGSPL